MDAAIKEPPCGFGQSLGRPIVRSISHFFWSAKKKLTRLRDRTIFFVHSLDLKIWYKFKKKLSNLNIYFKLGHCGMVQCVCIEPYHVIIGTSMWFWSVALADQLCSQFLIFLGRPKNLVQSQRPYISFLSTVLNFLSSLFWKLVTL
jgi:hypothetical protein